MRAFYDLGFGVSVNRQMEKDELSGVRVHYLFDKSGRPSAEHDAAT